MKINKYFPGFTPKAITFSIDDGSVKYDKIFIDTVAPSGIKGTFNLYFDRVETALSDEEYREMYRGFEVSNHCNRHPFAIDPAKEYNFTDEPFVRETADKNLVYKGNREGIYRIYHRNYWATLATREAYLSLAEEGKRDIEKRFGKGSVKGFVWPYGRQNDEKLFEALKSAGYSWIRRGYGVDFSIPDNIMDWGVNADSTNFEKKILEFEAQSDDGELKFFCFGLHSYDYERDGKWQELKLFCEKYGKRPNDFWYATNSEIFEYDAAMKNLTVSDGKMINPTETELFVALEGRKYILPPKSETLI